MRIAKIHIIFIIIAISFTYSSLIIVLFSYLHTSVLGLSSSLFSFFFLILIGYHFINYIFYKNYKKIAINNEFLNKKLFKNQIELSYRYNAEYFKEALKAYLKLRNNKIRGLEFLDDLDVVVMSKRGSFFKWEELIFCNISKVENKHTRIVMFYNFEDDRFFESFVEHFRKLDLLNFNYNNN